MTQITFGLPLYPDRYAFTEKALGELAAILDTGKVPMTAGADGPPVGTVQSARVEGNAVICVAEVDADFASDLAGVGLDVRVPKNDADDGVVDRVVDAPAVIGRIASQLQDGARPLEGR